MKTCPNCGSSQVFFRRVLDDKRWGKRITYHKCLGCMVEFHEDLQNIDEFYSSGEYREKSGLTPAKAHNVTRNRSIGQVRWLDSNFRNWRLLGEPVRMLDVGAYDGVTVEVLRENGIDAYGYEPDEVAASNSEFVTTDVSGLGKFHMLWMSHMLEHVPSAIETLKLWKPYADLAFVEVPPGNYQYPHILVFDQAAFKRTVELAGMKIVVYDPGIRAILEV